MSMPILSLSQLGWRAGLAQQLDLSDLDAGYPARVSSVHRGRLSVICEQGEQDVPLHGAGDAPVAVGDWLLIERATGRVLRRLERLSLVARAAAGPVPYRQPIAANLDTLFVVTSCNDEFNPSRLERYLAIALESGVEPVFVLTKTDLCPSPGRFVAEAQRVAPQVPLVALDALSGDPATALAQWLGIGRTVAFVGSSGVGKSTLINRLLGREAQRTGAIREHDDRGRHTTTSRQMFAMPGGAWLIDTPGMRALRIGAVEAGVRAVFADLEALTTHCRFRDCSHEADAGCALLEAVRQGRLEPRRLRSFLKLQREAAAAARTERERREGERRRGREYKSIQRRRRAEKGGEP